MIKLSLQGEIIKELASVTDAASALGIDRGDIYRVCKGDRISAGEFRLEFNGGNKIAR